MILRRKRSIGNSLQGFGVAPEATQQVGVCNDIECVRVDDYACIFSNRSRPQSYFTDRGDAGARGLILVLNLKQCDPINLLVSIPA